MRALWSRFNLGVCLLPMKKMKRPADLMNSAARITTASRTTGCVTARTTVETTQTSRAAVSTRLLLSLSVHFIHLYTHLTLYTRPGAWGFGPLWRHLTVLHPSLPLSHLSHTLVSVRRRQNFPRSSQSGSSLSVERALLSSSQNNKGSSSWAPDIDLLCYLPTIPFVFQLIIAFVKKFFFYCTREMTQVTQHFGFQVCFFALNSVHVVCVSGIVCL